MVIYKLSPEAEITRVTEGLSPGPLLKLSGDYLDSHAIGAGVDFSIGGVNAKSGDAESAILSAFANFGGVVAYRDFYHADGRKGKVSYIDMRNAKLPSPAQDCSSFEFSKVRQIAAGYLREDSSLGYAGFLETTARRAGILDNCWEQPLCEISAHSAGDGCRPRKTCERGVPITVKSW